MAQGKQSWDERRVVLDQIIDFFEEQLRLARIAIEAAGREDETDLTAAMLLLADLEGPPDYDFELSVPVATDGGYNN